MANTDILGSIILVASDGTPLLTTNGVYVQGSVASGATDAGNPVKVGGKYNSTRPTYTNGQRGDVQLSAKGAVGVVYIDVNGNDIGNYFDSTYTDNLANVSGLYVAARLTQFNGTGWDRRRGNYEETVLASAARTATLQSADLTNYNARGVVVVIDVTASSATPSVVFTIQGKSSLGSDYYTILASAAVTGVGQTVLRVYPGITAAANLSVSDVLPRIWRVDATHSDADSITYSVSANYIV